MDEDCNVTIANHIPSDPLPLSLSSSICISPRRSSGSRGRRARRWPQTASGSACTRPRSSETFAAASAAFRRSTTWWHRRRDRAITANNYKHKTHTTTKSTRATCARMDAHGASEQEREEKIDKIRQHQARCFQPIQESLCMCPLHAAFLGSWHPGQSWRWTCSRGISTGPAVDHPRLQAGAEW